MARFKSIARTLRENQLATPKYTMEATCNPTVTVKTYVDEVKDANIAIWANIANDRQVKKALSAVATMGYSNTDAFHHATSYLLNCISNAYLKAKAKAKAKASSASSPAETPIVFSTARNKFIPGDYLDAEIKPDLTAFASNMAQLAEALRASGDPPFDELVNFPLNLSFGEWKMGPAGLGQLLWYLSALKRARPDLPTVTGLFLDASKRLVLISVNACGAWSSEPVSIGFQHIVSDAQSSASGRKAKGKGQKGRKPNVKKTIPSTDTWISYVVLLYRAHADRDPNFSLISTNAKPARAHWEVTLDKFTPTVRPFHATLGPGRMTWASFALEPSHSNPSSSSPSLANGFFKTSWQDVNAAFHESKLLELAHKKTWLPGLVRHWSTALDTSRQVSLHYPPLDSTPIRHAEHVYLASIGHPLSQCESALHFLKTIYDAAETHVQLLNRGILQGDMSWFNILCNPWHDDATVTRDKPVAEGIPCIDYILTGAKTSQPCALVLDLDHAADLTALSADGRGEKTGTPMFVSIELSSADKIKIGNYNSLSDLEKHLSVLDGRPELFARAQFGGPYYDDNFMKNFRRVVEHEKERVSSGTPATTNPAARHRPRHDVESLYWILVWGFSRACPSGQHPHGTVGDALSRFVDAMLNHCLGEDEDSRADRLYGSGISRNLLHESLRDMIHPVLQDLGTYLAIPWHLYDDIVAPQHAHVAIRRLLLPLIDDIHKRKVRNVFFNTEQPRTAVTRQTASLLRQAPSNHGTQALASASAAARESARVAQESARVSALARVSAQASARVSDRQIKSNSRCKPGATETQENSPLPSPEQGSPSILHAERDSNTVDDGSKMRELLNRIYKRRESLEEVGAKRPVDDEVNEEANKRAKKDGPNPLDVDALIDMFRNDRHLWFGSGFRSNVEAQAVIGPSGLTV